MNVLDGLGRAHVHLQNHVLESKSDHPDGPGALEFYRLSGRVEKAVRAYRKELMSDMRFMWPKAVCVDGKPAEGCHLGICTDQEVTEETTQFASCALTLALNYVLTGVIPEHLQRASVLASKMVEKLRRLRAARKRPAAANP